MRISDWSSDVCSSDLAGWVRERLRHYVMAGEQVKPSTLRKGRVTMGKVKRTERARVEFVTAMDATPARPATAYHNGLVKRTKKHSGREWEVMTFMLALCSSIVQPQHNETRN